MKKILCYLGILILFTLGILPPVLRSFYKEDNKKEEEKLPESAILVCTSDTYMTTTSYEDDEVKKIAIKKIITNKESEESIDEQENLDTEKPEDNEEMVEKTDMDLLFDSLKENKELIYNNLEDGEIIGIDFSVSKYESIDLSNLTKSKEDQKTYYENLKLTCIIRK